MIRTDVEKREMLFDLLKVAKNPCPAFDPCSPRPRVAEWFVALVTSKVVFLALFGLGIVRGFSTMAWREIEQNNRRGLEPTSKASGQTIQFEAMFFWVHSAENLFVGRMYFIAALHARPKFENVRH